VTVFAAGKKKFEATRVNDKIDGLLTVERVKTFFVKYHDYYILTPPIRFFCLLQHDNNIIAKEIL
jgi:hypothetical protein